MVLAALSAGLWGLWAWKIKLQTSGKAADGHENTSPSEQAAGDTAAPRKFYDMSARESRHMLDKLNATTADEYFQFFLDAGRINQDPLKQSMLQGRMQRAIGEKKYSAGFIAEMKKFILDKSSSDLERGLVITAFAYANTKEGVEFVLWVISSEADADSKRTAKSSIGGMGGAQPYLPALIEPLWRESKDADLLTSVAQAMARQGAPSGIELLLATLAAPDGQDDVRLQAAIWATTKIYRDEAIPPLATALKNNPPGSRMNLNALSLLSHLSNNSAAPAVVEWLQTADISAAPHVAIWIKNGNESHLRAAEAALNPSVPFRSEENREAMRKALAERGAGKK